MDRCLITPPPLLKTRNNDPPGAPAFVCDPLGHQKLCFSASQSDNTGGNKTKKTKGLNLFLISFAVRVNRDKELGSVSLAFLLFLSAVMDLGGCFWGVYGKVNTGGTLWYPAWTTWLLPPFFFFFFFLSLPWLHPYLAANSPPIFLGG